MQQILNLLTSLNNQANYRTLTPQQHKNLEISYNQKWLLNLASNDYLNLASNENLKESFLDSEIFRKNCFFSASSSRSLSGNFEIYAIFEEFLESLFDKKALLFNSGYHANIGIISSLNHLKNVLFLVDKSIHASHIDGLKSFKKLNFKRFLHNDMQSLTNLLEKYHNHYEAIFILSEGIFSIEGDFAKLQNLIGLKHRFKNVYLYLDEAHSIGSFGDNGLGLAHSLDYLKDIDFLILTFGKAIGSVGACVLCNQTFKEYFINTARSLIYSTALPPLNVAMSYFIFSRLHSFKKQRKALKTLSLNFKSSLESLELFEVLGDYNILSIVLKENQKTIFFQQKLQECGFFLPAIKPPTTAKNRACLRISLCANIPQERLEILIKSLLKINNEYLSRYKK
ncbi:aminotransferase class I/II-fold pyridoxal phosphate-dependent enzyme [Helicobacter apodemus]|uniref:8-amino-7-oxononanoate synthase n=1 Tax=Helicobacter apodemus TaxID=135569 RepID=A0A4U8UF48_9HELI|nr:aminotransferase class I/II-fold pyridoxal phosphate-dependent enzyme [Helicobacter apodemus]TLE16531.1 aminotransferase class I/II-fold pyridoxal phosphate-dependent enzyme [Helicobacter apodemus]